MTTTSKNRIMIYGPKDDGTYVVEFKTAADEVLAISAPGGEARVIRHFRSVCPMGCSRRRLREVKKAPASLYRGFKCVSEV
jgi:hypothetical protein